MSDDKTKHITLYNEAAEQFEQFQQEVAERRNGIDPGNAETVRILLGAVDLGDRKVF